MLKWIKDMILLIVLIHEIRADVIEIKQAVMVIKARINNVEREQREERL